MNRIRVEKHLATSEEHKLAYLPGVLLSHAAPKCLRAPKDCSKVSALIIDLYLCLTCQPAAKETDFRPPSFSHHLQQIIRLSHLQQFAAAVCNIGWKKADAS